MESALEIVPRASKSSPMRYMCGNEEVWTSWTPASGTWTAERLSKAQIPPEWCGPPLETYTPRFEGKLKTYKTWLEPAGQLSETCEECIKLQVLWISEWLDELEKMSEPKPRLVRVWRNP